MAVRPRQRLGLARSVGVALALGLALTAGLAGVRASCGAEVARAAAAAPLVPPDASWSDVERRLGRLSQEDVLAFPAHAAVGLTFEVAGCPPRAAWLHWRKAAAHAAWQPAAVLAAHGLARTASPRGGADYVLADLRWYAHREPWHRDRLERVATAFRALTSTGVPGPPPPPAVIERRGPVYVR